jgi:hypothetical protein
VFSAPGEPKFPVANGRYHPAGPSFVREHVKIPDGQTLTAANRNCEVSSRLREDGVPGQQDGDPAPADSFWAAFEASALQSQKQPMPPGDRVIGRQ